MSSDWSEKSLSDFATIQRGMSYSSGDLGDRGAPFLNLKSVAKGGGYSSRGLKRFTGTPSPAYEVRFRDLLIANTDLTRDASVVGAPILAPEFGENAYFSMDLSRLQLVGEAALPEFLAYRMQLSDVRSFMQARARGSTVLHLDLKDVPSLQLRLPPLPEQRRIAEILDTIDEAIRKTEEVIAKLEQMKQGLLHDLLTHGIDENGELRDPERHPEQFKDSPLGRIPRGWSVAGFADFTSSARPFIKTGPFGSALKGEHWTDEGVPVITIGALGEGDFVKSELLYVSETKARSLAAYRVRAGDVVFSRVADVGRSVVVTTAEAGWVLSSNLMWISLDPLRVVPDFIWLNLSGNEVVRRQIRQLVNAGGRDVANGKVLRAMRLAWPQYEEQQRITEAVSRLYARSTREMDLLVKLKEQKRGLMDDLLTGRVCVSVEDKEVAR